MVPFPVGLAAFFSNLGVQHIVGWVVLPIGKVFSTFLKIQKTIVFFSLDQLQLLHQGQPGHGFAVMHPWAI
tara:strand:- start:7199 stop:7411 length:213 start_codon:yes stop_codon:yes gene_type:complete